jgi:hypothetical protein
MAVRTDMPKGRPPSDNEFRGQHVTPLQRLILDLLERKRLRITEIPASVDSTDDAVRHEIQLLKEQFGPTLFEKKRTGIMIRKEGE